MRNPESLHRRNKRIYVSDESVILTRKKAGTQKDNYIIGEKDKKKYIFKPVQFCGHNMSTPLESGYSFVKGEGSGIRKIKQLFLRMSGSPHHMVHIRDLLE